MKTKLITALRISAKAIEQGTIDYDWYNCFRCNCGVLACAILGVAPSKLSIPKTTEGDEPGPFWAQIVGRHCPLTGMPEHKTLKALFEAGLTAKDLIELEELSNEAILQRAGMLELRRRHFLTSKTVLKSNADKSYADDVVKYMRAWADLLTEQGADDVVPQMQPEQVA